MNSLLDPTVDGRDWRDLVLYRRDSDLVVPPLLVWLSDNCDMWALDTPESGISCFVLDLEIVLGVRFHSSVESSWVIFVLSRLELVLIGSGRRYLNLAQNLLSCQCKMF